jgi:hypothetical protein
MALEIWKPPKTAQGEGGHSPGKCQANDTSGFLYSHMKNLQSWNANPCWSNMILFPSFKYFISLTLLQQGGGDITGRNIP